MIEVLKQALEALKDVGVLTDREWQAVHKNKVNELRQAIAELESQEPVAWMHIMDNTEGIKANGAGIVSITQKRKHPFGKAGIDFSKSYPVTSTPLYTHPPQRTWVGLTKEDKDLIEDLCDMMIGDAAFSTIDAILKGKNT